MDSPKYVGMDVHTESISIAVRNSAGKVVMECIIETKANMITRPDCGSMPPMPRFSATLVVLALLAAPLSVLARGIFCDPSECTCATICPMHASHSSSQPMCNMAKHVPMCGTHQGRHALDYGFITPFAPTIPLAHAQLANPLWPGEFLTSYSRFFVGGISSAPFEPPRS